MVYEQLGGGGGAGNDSRLHVSDAQPSSGDVTKGDLWSKTAAAAEELFRATDSSTFVSVETTGSGSMTTVQEAGSQVGGADIVTLNYKAGFDITEPTDTLIDIDLDLSELSDQTLQLLLASLTAATELTIATGDITATQSFHSVDTESDAASDNLDGINGGVAGDILAIRPANDARTIVVRHNQSAAAADNILLHGGVDISLTEIEDVLFLIYDATLDTNGAWIQLSGVTYFDDATSDPLDVTTAAADGTENSPARKDHAHNIAEAAITQHEAAVDHDALTNFVAAEHQLEAAIDHDALTNFVAGEHIAEASIDHDALTNFVAAEHKLEAAIDHDALTNFVAAEHQLEAAIDHDALTNFVSLEHVPVTDATSDPLVDGVAADGTEATVARKDHVHPKHHSNESGLNFIIDGGGLAITTGIKGDIEMPFAGTITAVRLFADQSGSIVVDIWKDTYANFPPTDADSITASAVPTISTAVKSEDANLTGWTTAFAKGDILRFNVDSITTVERVTLSLSVTKT